MKTSKEKPMQRTTHGLSLHLRLAVCALVAVLMVLLLYIIGHEALEDQSPALLYAVTFLTAFILDATLHLSDSAKDQ